MKVFKKYLQRTWANYSNFLKELETISKLSQALPLILARYVMIATCTFYCVLDQFKMKEENSLSDGGN